MLRSRWISPLLLALALILPLTALVGTLGRADPPPAPTAPPTPEAAFPGVRPDRPTRTAPPSMPTPFALPTAPLTSLVTAPFSFPTVTAAPATPVTDCTDVFPIASVEAIRFGVTSTDQLRAAFGPPASTGGRPPSYRFSHAGCTLAVEIEGAAAQAAELRPYATLDWVLARYGPPAGVGISQGNLVLLLAGQTVLLYPERGAIALFDALPDALTRSTPIAALQFRPPFSVDQQVRRLKLAPVPEWTPPLR